MLLSSCSSYAFKWQDLWQTPNQQAQQLMNNNKFSEAELLFTDKAWQSVAAYRSQHYKRAVELSKTLDNEMGWYNQGNALAQLNQFEEAIKAYDKALSLNPGNKDAVFNRELLKKLLEKKQEEQKNSDQSQDKKNEQQDSKNNKSKDNQSKADKNNNSEDKSSKSETKPEDTQQQSESKNESKQSKSEPEKNTPKPELPPQTNAGSNNNSPEKNKTDNQPKQVSPETTEQKEDKLAKEQWLRLIPDEPGGLLREKFLRDYLRKQQGWY